MSNNKKPSTNKIVRYLRELSVVVIGIAITVSVTLWVSRMNEKRDIKLYLIAITAELKENTKKLEFIKRYSQREMLYTNYLKSNVKEARDADSLAYYASHCAFSVEKFLLKSNAFDMFKSSGLMRLLVNQESMLTLWQTYDYLSRVETGLDWIADHKWEQIKIEMSRIGEGTMSTEDLINTPIMYDFYIFDMYATQMIGIENALNDAKETIEKLEKYCGE